MIIPMDKRFRHGFPVVDVRRGSTEDNEHLRMCEYFDIITAYHGHMDKYVPKERIMVIGDLPDNCLTDSYTFLAYLSLFC